MSKLFAWLFLAAIVLGIAGLAVTTERASGQLPPVETRFHLSCTQTGVPDGTPGAKGEVTCSLRVDIPDPLPLPDELKLTIVATYVDNDGNGEPSRGDRLQCIKVTGPDGTVFVDRCRPEVPTPAGP